MTKLLRFYLITLWLLRVLYTYVYLYLIIKYSAYVSAANFGEKQARYCTCDMKIRASKEG